MDDGDASGLTRSLAIYGAAVGTISVVWVLYSGAILDRARIRVTAYEAELITPGVDRRQPVFGVKVANRGRRAVTITHVAYVRSARATHGGHVMSADMREALAARHRLEEGESYTYQHGQMGGYAHGDLPLKRWYVTDGAGRVHPLRERHRQRLERAAFWLPKKLAARRSQRAPAPGGRDPGA